MSASYCHGFALPEDGWFHIASPGEWPHKPTGLLQVLDDDAMASIVQSFQECSQQPNWPGVLIDFDHQSLDTDKPSVAAGWIISLEQRPNGIWAQIRWSDIGQKSIEGGRYRFISPVWRSTDCALLGDDRIRPLKLMNCAVTNDPNIKGLYPLSNTSVEIPMRFAPPALPLVPPSIHLRNRGSMLLRNAAEFRSGYNPRTDRRLTEEQRKAFFARRGGGGSGGGSGGGDSRTGTTPTSNETPRYARDHEARLAELKSERETLAAEDFGPAPTKTSYELMDVREVKREAMKTGGDATNVLDAVQRAKVLNADRKADLDAVRRSIKKQYKTKDAQERALERHLYDLDKDHDRAMSDWRKAQGRQNEAIREIDRKIAGEEIRQTESERRAQIQDRETAEKARQQAVRDQILHDKEAARVKLAQEREAKKTKEEPVRQYKAELRRRAAYVDALSRGDDFYAAQLAPEADHAKMKAAITAIQSASPDSSDYAKMKRHLDALRLQPLPLRSETP